MNYNALVIGGFVTVSMLIARELAAFNQYSNYFDRDHVRTAVTSTGLVFFGIGLVIGMRIG